MHLGSDTLQTIQVTSHSRVLTLLCLCRVAPRHALALAVSQRYGYRLQTT